MSVIDVLVKDLPVDLEVDVFCENLKVLLKKAGILTRGCVAIPDADEASTNHPYKAIRVDAHGTPDPELIGHYVGRCLTETSGQTFDLSARLAV